MKEDELLESTKSMIKLSVCNVDGLLLTGALHESEIEQLQQQQQQQQQQEDDEQDLEDNDDDGDGLIAMATTAAAAAADDDDDDSHYTDSWCRCCCSFFRYNAFFFGSLFATISSLSDLRNAWIDFQHDDEQQQQQQQQDHYDRIDSEKGAYNLSSIIGNMNDNDKEGEYSDLSPWRYWTLYKALVVASTFMYLLDSLIHIFFTGGDNNDQDIDDDNDDDNDDDDHNNNIRSSNSSSSSSSMHSRMAFSVVFGVAASLDLMSCVLDDDYIPWPAYYLETAAVHLYLLSAFMTLAANKNVYLSSTTAAATTTTTTTAIFTQKWLMLGDLFFLAGSIVDVCVNYWDHPNAPDSGMLWVACWGLVSSLLWLVDSIIYRWADEDLFEEPVVQQQHHHHVILNADDTDTDREDDNNVMEHEAEIDVAAASSCCIPATIVKESELLSTALLLQKSSQSDVLKDPPSLTMQDDLDK